MSYRITTNGMLRNYQSNLYKNTRKVYDTMEKVQTGRKFNSYAENPVAASTAFRFRRAYWNAGNQIDNSNYVISKFSTGWNALDQIIDGNSDHPGLTGIEDALRALNDPTGSSRRTLGQDMLSMAKSVVMLMNVKYGDEFVFAGADGLNVPFTWGESGELYYRGVSVNAPKTLTQQQFDALLNPYTRALTNDLSSMEAYGKFAQYYAGKNATYDDYSDWFDAANPKITSDQFESLYDDYDKVSEFRKSVANKAMEDGATDYDAYLAWYESLDDPALTKLSEERFYELKEAGKESGEYDAMGGFTQYVADNAIAGTDYQDYLKYVNPDGEDPFTPDLPEEEFNLLSDNYEELSAFKQYVEKNEDNEDTLVTGSYDDYVKWFDDVNGKLPDEPALKAALDEGKLQDFAEYYTEQQSLLGAVTYDDYQEWYVNDYVEGGLSGIMSDEDFAALEGDYSSLPGYESYADGAADDYGMYEQWYNEKLAAAGVPEKLTKEVFEELDPDGDYSNDPLLAGYIEDGKTIADGYEAYTQWYDAKVEKAKEAAGLPERLTEEKFTELDGDYSGEDLEGYEDYAKDQVLSDPATYEKWYVDQQFEKAAIRFDEATYVDIGIGLEFDADGNVIPSSAFNSALSGLDVLGFGTDEDGDPLNIVELMRSLGELFESSDPDTGTYPEEFTYNGVTYYNSPDGEVEALADRLTNKLHDAIGRVTEQHVALDSKVSYLQKNKGQLESKRYDMNEQIETIEQEDPAVAIMEWSWARMTYQAALQIGNSILSHSLLDYMN